MLKKRVGLRLSLVSRHLLVNGASVGILAAILAATAQSPGCSILLPRNAHRACWNGLALAGCQPVWLPVEYDKTTGLRLSLVSRHMLAEAFFRLIGLNCLH